MTFTWVYSRNSTVWALNYLTTLCHMLTVLYFLMRHGRMVTINEREGTWKEAIVSCFRWLISRCCPEDKAGMPSARLMCVDIKFEVEVLSPLPQSSVKCCTMCTRCWASNDRVIIAEDVDSRGDLSDFYSGGTLSEPRLRYRSTFRGLI